MLKLSILLSLIILAIAVFLFCITNPVVPPTILKVYIPASQDRLYKDVEALTQIRPYRNYRNTASLDKAADYIKSEFDKLDCTVERQKYEAKGSEYQNIIASFGTEHSSRIIVGAHYDVCGNQDGADDNASAVAGLLEIARLIDKVKPKLKHRIDFVAYSLEEPPFFRTQKMGSAVHANSLKEAGIDIELMVCLEMIGYYSEEEGSQDYPIPFMKALYPDKGNFIAVIGKMGQIGTVRKIKRNMAAVANIDVKSINAPKVLQGIDFSDHRNYWANGYNAIMINNTAFYRNKNYHETSDTIETLDFEKMTQVVRGAYWAIINW